MRKLLLAAALAAVPLLAAPPAVAQSGCTYIVYGAVLTAAQWNACFAAKNNTLNYTPVNKAGDAMSGKLTTSVPNAVSAGLNLPPGSAPTSPVNGDLWTTASGLSMRINSATLGPFNTATFTGPAGPASPALYQFWVDTSSSIIPYKQWDGVQWVTVGTLNPSTHTWSPSPAGTVSSFSGGTTGLTPSSATMGAITLAGTLAPANGGTGITSLGTGVAAWLGTPTSSNLRAAITDESGTGALLFANGNVGNATGTSLALGGATLGSDALAVTGTASFSSRLAVTGAVNGSSDIRAGTANNFYWQTRSKMSAPADGQILLTNNAGTDFGRLQFGGTSAGFPALVRSGAELHTKLADDSAFATSRAQNFVAQGGQFYGSSGTYLRAVSDGVWQFSNSAGTDFNRLQFGGTTSSFPAIKRSGSGLVIRNGDDTAYNDLTARLIISTTDFASTAATSYFYASGGSSSSFNIRISSTDTIINAGRTGGGSLLFGGVSSSAGDRYLCATNSTGAVTFSNAVCGVSSRRFKEDVSPLATSDMRSAFMALRPVTFRYKKSMKISGTQIGLIAEDVDAIPAFKGIVTREKDGKTAHGLDYQQLTPVLIAMVQKQEREIAALRAELRHLNHR